MDGVLISVDESIKDVFAHNFIDMCINKIDNLNAGIVENDCKLSMFNMILSCADIDFIFNDEQLDNVRHISECINDY